MSPSSAAVHLSDLHLGHIHGAGFMRYVAQKVNALEADMVLITGDLLDGLGGNFADYLDAIDLLEARHGVFFVIGNHEIYNQAAHPALSHAHRHPTAGRGNGDPPHEHRP